MKLHENKDEFGELITLTAQEKHIPESAVERDYYQFLGFVGLRASFREIKSMGR